MTFSQPIVDVPAISAPTPALQQRLDRIEELRRNRSVDRRIYFGMRFFVGIESAVKRQSCEPGPRRVFDAVTATLRARTLTRGHAARTASAMGISAVRFDEPSWERRGLGLDPGLMGGFADLVEDAATAAGEVAGVDPVAELPAAFLGFVRMDLAVRTAGDRTSLGGEPDSANFFSFAELAFWKLDRGIHPPFWLALARAAVSAQPAYLAVNFLKARRTPRRQADYGPADVLHAPEELAKRLRAAPAFRSLDGVSPDELERLAGEHASHGFLAAPSRE